MFGNIFEKISEKLKFFSGDLVCGDCHCFDRPDFGDTFFGDRCQCPGNHSSPLNPESSCRQDGQLQLCSGRGSCECGVCQCDKQLDMEVWGPFCECDNVSCDRSSGTGNNDLNEFAAYFQENCVEVMEVVSVENVSVTQGGLVAPVTASMPQSSVCQKTLVIFVVVMAPVHVAHVHARMVGRDATVIIVPHVWTHVTSSNSVWSVWSGPVGTSCGRWTMRSTPRSAMRHVPYSLSSTL